VLKLFLARTVDFSREALIARYTAILPTLGQFGQPTAAMIGAALAGKISQKRGAAAAG